MTLVEADTRLTRRRREIVEAARLIVERDGESALTMRRLAADLGMKAPSLYKHFPDKEALELELIVLGFAVVFIESANAKLRILRLPEFLGTASALAILALVTELVLS